MFTQIAIMTMSATGLYFYTFAQIAVYNLHECFGMCLLKEIQKSHAPLILTV